MPHCESLSTRPVALTRIIFSSLSSRKTTPSHQRPSPQLSSLRATSSFERPVISAPVSMRAWKRGSASAMYCSSFSTVQPGEANSHRITSGEVSTWIILPSEPFS